MSKVCSSVGGQISKLSVFIQILRSKQQQQAGPGMMFVKQEEGDEEEETSGHLHTLHQEHIPHPQYQHQYWVTIVIMDLIVVNLFCISLLNFSCC